MGPDLLDGFGARGLRDAEEAAESRGDLGRFEYAGGSNGFSLGGCRLGLFL